MAAPKRTPTQRENDLERISALYLKGKRQVDIAAELGVTQQQVSYDLKTIHKRWRESTTINIDEAKHRELDRIDLLEQTYWAAWQRSLDERTKTRTERNTLGGGENQVSRDKASIEKETLLGIPAYLAGVERCIELRCKILGVYVAQKHEHTGKVDSTVTLQDWRQQTAASRKQADSVMDDFANDVSDDPE